MNLMNFFKLCVVLFVAGMWSCASVSGFEEGRALGDGGSELIVAANYMNIPTSLTNSDNVSENVGFPNLEVSYKHGVTNKLDVGGRFNTNLNLGGFLKYQILGDDQSKFALGTGLELSTAVGLLYNAQIPVNMTFYPTDAVAINISPKFVYQFPAGAFDVSATYLGGNFGLLFGRRHKFGIDVGYYRIGIDNVSSNLITFGLGGKFRWY